MTAIHGTAAPGFVLVREAIASNFSERTDVGAAVALVIYGRIVVDLWGGVADPAEGREWNADTLANIYGRPRKALQRRALQCSWTGDKLTMICPLPIIGPNSVLPVNRKSLSP